MAASKKKGNRPGRARTDGRWQKRGSTREESESGIRSEIILCLVLALSVLLLISNFHLGGAMGEAISSVAFGLFGVLAYVLPFVLFFGFSFYMANRDNRLIRRKMIGLAILVVFLCAFTQLLFTGYDKGTNLGSYYTGAADEHTGGGIIGGMLVKLFGMAFGTAGAYVLTIAGLIIGAVVLTQRPLISTLHIKSRDAVKDAHRHHVEAKAERRRLREEEEEEIAAERAALEKRRAQNPESERASLPDVALTGSAKKNGFGMKSLLQGGTKASASNTSAGVRAGEGAVPSVSGKGAVSAAGAAEAANTTPLFTGSASKISDVPSPEELSASLKSAVRKAVQGDRPAPSAGTGEEDSDEIPGYQEEKRDGAPAAGASGAASANASAKAPAGAGAAAGASSGASGNASSPDGGARKHSSEEDIKDGVESIKNEIGSAEKPAPVFKLPGTDMLTKGKNVRGDSEQHLMETAQKLQQTFHDFGVNVRVTNVSRGPTVTRYELQPEHGVKVSKILSLSDDIKLNLATADIRIEAPIPGKAAVGIEVPNKENSAVMLRDMLESEEYRSSKKPLSFAVGKDIGGKPIIADIAKMPHLLIAGATGSGKSVCINTLIMSILFKAKPDEVRMLMIDPKVVELKMYNGIPHLLIPVVTDPKKASGALNWAVAEMTDRYNKFAEFNGVRDIDSYNERVEKINANPDVTEKLPKMPLIVVIVDELADLMMVAPGEVEDAICRLAQLARAAGIHLIIATQRPSVNVVTGLIKANMPSRIALSVSSGVDSRTIIDMNGAEKLLGKGDMLFYPQGYAKPARVQGAYVSDDDIAAVVKFLSSQSADVVYNKEVEDKISESINNSPEAAGNSSDDRDEYFWEAGLLIIDKDKASIGMLQRVFKIGFNRAARIMDQLCEAGVVGEEDGTKPRNILMSQEQFENMKEQES